MNDRPADASLTARLAELVAAAHSGDGAFEAAAAEARRLAATAGAQQSESWIAAEEALTRAIAARDATARALGDIDSLGGDRLQANDGMAPNDLAAIQRASAEVGAIDERQSRTVKAIQATLGR